MMIIFKYKLSNSPVISELGISPSSVLKCMSLVIKNTQWYLWWQKRHTDKVWSRNMNQYIIQDTGLWESGISCQHRMWVVSDLVIWVDLKTKWYADQAGRPRQGHGIPDWSEKLVTVKLKWLNYRTFKISKSAAAAAAAFFPASSIIALCESITNIFVTVTAWETAVTGSYNTQTLAQQLLLATSSSSSSSSSSSLVFLVEENT